MKIAALQLTSLPLDDIKLRHYIKAASEAGVEIILLGEYVLNLFFSEIKNLPLEMIQDQSSKHLESLKALCNEFNIVILAPLVSIKNKKPYKVMYRISPNKKLHTYYQQKLIPFEHWNEAAFYANEKCEHLKLDTFIHKGLKCCNLFGYELHFDELWLEIKRKEVDIVFIPTASTFESQKRWREIIKSRAFIATTYILRANRVGEYRDKEHTWRFYGDTLICGVDGEIIDSLGDKEELLIATIEKKEIRETRKHWSIR